MNEQLTDETLETYATAEGVLSGNVVSMARELLAHRRATPADQIDAARVAEAVENEGGNWVSCSGCHELNEGHPTGQYSPALQCYLGAGCRECGGIGAIWDTTDYTELGGWLARRDAADATTADDLRAALERASRYLPDDIVRCRGDKCREPWCASCFGEDDAEAFMVNVEADKAAIRAALSKGGDA